MPREPLTVDELLTIYRQYPVKQFLHIYGLTNLPPDDEFRPDEHGRALMGFDLGYELTDVGSADEPLCIQIHTDAHKEDVIALLRRAADELEQRFYTYMIPENQERFWQAARDLLDGDDEENLPADNDD